MVTPGTAGIRHQPQKAVVHPGSGPRVFLAATETKQASTSLHLGKRHDKALSIHKVACGLVEFGPGLSGCFASLE